MGAGGPGDMTSEIVDADARGSALDLGTAGYVRLLSAVYVSSFLIRTSFGITTVTLGRYVESSHFGLGLIVSASPLLELVTVLFLGVIIDRHGRKETLLGGLGLGAVSLFGLALSRDPWVLFGIHALHGVAAAAILITTLALIADYTPRELRGREMGIYDFTNLFGWIVGFSVGFVLLGIFQSDLRLTFVLSGALALAGLGYAAVAIIEPHRHRHTYEDADARSILEVVREREVFLLLAPWFVVFVLVGAILTFLSRTLSGALQLDEFATAGGILVLGGVFLASQIVFGKLSDRYGREPLMLLGAAGFVGLMATVWYLLATAPAPGPAALWGHLLAHWLPLGALILAALAFSPAALAALADFAQRHPKGITMSVYSVVAAAGMIVAPPTVGFIADTWGGLGVALFFLLLTVAMLALVVYRWLHHHPSGQAVRDRVTFEAARWRSWRGR